MDDLEKECFGELMQQIKSINSKVDDLSTIFAEKFNTSEINYFVPENDILFVDFYWFWLQEHQFEIEPRTYIEYTRIFNKHIKPYFMSRNITLRALTSEDIQMYYNYKMSVENLSPNSVIKHHANIFTCLKYAKRKGKIASNPMDNVDKPKISKYMASYYTPEQLIILFDIAKKKNSTIYTPIVLAGLLGLRRSEIVALKWSTVDFVKQTITIQRKAYLGENNVNIVTDKLKTKSSYRILCLPSSLSTYLSSLKTEQEKLSVYQYKTKDFMDYVCLDKFGNVVDLYMITNQFRYLIKSNNLPYIRFHDLRHSCASMLLALGYDLKIIQEWLGHSNIQTTANIYTHVNNAAKFEMANNISSTFSYEF